MVLVADNARLEAEALSVAWATLLLTRLLLVEVALLPSAGLRQTLQKRHPAAPPFVSLVLWVCSSPPETKNMREHASFVSLSHVPLSLLSPTFHPSFPCRSSSVSFYPHSNLLKLLSSSPPLAV